jgi:hypothetical protein
LLLCYTPCPLTLSLAFLAPQLVKAVVEGRLPRGIYIERLRDPDTNWTKQFQDLGLNPNWELGTIGQREMAIEEASQERPRKCALSLSSKPVKRKKTDATRNCSGLSIYGRFLK